MEIHELVLLDLIERDVISKQREFLITEELLEEFNRTYVKLSGTSGNQTGREARFNKKLAALSFVKFKVDNKLKLLEGFVYVISNKAWPGYYKIGMSKNPKLRLSQYQTYSPLRDYKLHHWSFWYDRSIGEEFVHLLHKSTLDHEWVQIKESKLNKELSAIHKSCVIN